MPARRAPSPRCSSITISTSATSTASAPAASTSRSCPASCRCTISSRRAISSPAPAPRCRTGWRRNSKASMTMPRPRKLVAATVAAGQVQKLAKHGVDTFHFYTMNRADLVFAISHLLGIRPKAHRKPPDPMTVPVSPKRTALIAAARERILVLDGAMGTMIQALQYDEAAFRGERFADFHRDVRGNNDLLILTQPKAIEDIHADYLRAGADIVATNTFSSTSIAQADYDMSDLAYELNRDGAKLARAAAERVTAEDGKPRFVAGALGPDQPHRLDLARRLQPRLSRRHLRRSAQVLWRTGQRPARRRRRPAAGRNHLRHAERQGGALCDLRDSRRARHRRARDGLRHHHRQIRPPAVGPVAGSVLEFGAARQAGHHRLQLRARRRRSARAYRRHRPRRRYAGLRLSECRPAQRVRPV